MAGTYKTADDHAKDREAAKARKRRGRGVKSVRQEEVKVVSLVEAGRITRQIQAEKERKQREFEEGFKKIEEANRQFAAEFVERVKAQGSGVLLKTRKGYYFIRNLVKEAFRFTDYYWNEDELGLKVALRRK